MKKKLIYCTLVVLVLLLIKVIWVWCTIWDIGSWEDEKPDILNRCNFLSEKVITTPSNLLSEMPAAIGPQFQGEWALYSCSMLTKALANISVLYPETKDANIAKMDSIIEMAMSPEIRRYDTARWGEDPLESLDGDKSHISYLSHLAWMIGNYKGISGDTKYDEIYGKICATMSRRICESPYLNLPTYPGEAIYVPDMLVAIVTLNEYGSKYSDVVKKWLDKAKAEWLDKNTGMLVSFLDNVGKQYENAPVKGSYSALNCYYLSLIDKEFGEMQYELLKEQFMRGGILSGIKEYADRSPILDEDIDAGIIIFGLSPSGTAFAIGPSTIHGDIETRKKFLRTAEIAGHTIGGEHRHYLLANIALVGEAITLAMRTSIN